MSKNNRYNVNMKVLLIVLLVLLILYLLIGYFFYCFAIARNKPRFLKKLLEKGFDNDPKNNPFRPSDEERNWYDSLENKEEINLTSFDNLKLNGQLIKIVNSHDYFIGVHGYGGNRKEMIERYHNFYKQGFSGLLFDHRGCGKSEGSYYGMGYHESLDVTQWINYIIDQDEKAQIVLYGLSMGAATSMMLADNDFDKHIKCIIEDCGYSTVTEEFNYQMKHLFHLPGFPFVSAANLMTKLICNYSFKDINVIPHLQNAKVPMLFIHGEKDTFVPYCMLDKVYDACTSTKEKYSFPNAVHGESLFSNRERYWEIVNQFIDKYI